jgi:hypothetical protein
MKSIFLHEVLLGFVYHLKNYLFSRSPCFTIQYFFLEHAGELRIIELRKEGGSKNRPNTNTKKEKKGRNKKKKIIMAIWPQQNKMTT